MNDEHRFYICKKCGNLIGMIHFGGMSIKCCATFMDELIANTVESNSEHGSVAAEKHLPVVEKDGRCIIVKVGNVHHPMNEDHSINWVYLQTETGGQRKTLLPGKEPIVKFFLSEDDKPVSVYSYCNLHGLWKS